MKAVVLETRGREAAILRMDGIVCQVRGRYAVGQEIEYVEPARPSFMQWVAAALVAAMLLGGSAGLWISNNYVTYAEVSLDVNSSIVYTLNRRNRVLSVEAVNDDAADIVEALSAEEIRFMTIGDALEKTMDVLTAQGYLDSDSSDYVLASVSADDKRLQDTLSETVEAAFAKTMEHDPTMEYRIERTDRAAAKEAREYGMSPGRYAAWREQADAPEPDAFADIPVQQIIGKMETPEGTTESPGKSIIMPPADNAADQPDANTEIEAPPQPDEKSANPPSQTKAGNQSPEPTYTQPEAERSDAPARREGEPDTPNPDGSNATPLRPDSEKTAPERESGRSSAKKSTPDAEKKPSGGGQRGGEMGKDR